jgi:hypothetical protein
VSAQERERGRERARASERARERARHCIRLVSSRIIDTKANRHTGVAAIISRSCRFAILEDIPSLLHEFSRARQFVSCREKAAWYGADPCGCIRERGYARHARARPSGLGSPGVPAAALQSTPAR